jgi:hypothetical protein
MALDKLLPLTDKEKVLIDRIRRIRWGYVNVFVNDGRILLVKPTKRTIRFDCYEGFVPNEYPEVIAGWESLNKMERSLVLCVRDIEDNLLEILVKEGSPVIGKLDLNGLDLLDTTGSA